MIVYEKNNKLNINFNNEVSENPDLQIGKEDGKTEVLIDGQPGGSGGDSMECAIRETNGTYSCNMTEAEISSAIQNGTKIQFVYYVYDDGEYNGRLFFRTIICRRQRYKIGVCQHKCNECCAIHYD